MSRDAALKTALSLVKVPTHIRALRASPLPHGIDLLLNLAAGNEDAHRNALELGGRSDQNLMNAAGFFIEQILLHPDSDSYRVLGADPTATTRELRANMALLMRWLHPDLDPEGNRAHLANRVLRAWDDLKTPERRKAYDRLLACSRNGSHELRRTKIRRRKTRLKRPSHLRSFVLRVLRRLSPDDPSRTQ